jgi:hypothetical protein
MVVGEPKVTVAMLINARGKKAPILPSNGGEVVLSRPGSWQVTVVLAADKAATTVLAVIT